MKIKRNIIQKKPLYGDRSGNRMNYRYADKRDIDFLVKSRLEFTYEMRNKQMETSSQEYEKLKENCERYFQCALAEDTCDVILAEEDGKCVGTGIIFYYFSVPSAFNMEGKNAYITSLYVKPEYRKQGIGNTILKRLIQSASRRGYDIVMLSASELGKPMYEKLGFREIENNMIFDGRK